MTAPSPSATQCTLVLSLASSPLRHRAAAAGTALLAVLAAGCAHLPGVAPGPSDRAATPARSDVHALLLNGGGQRAINYQSHLRHIEEVLALLRESGITPDHITIFNSDGDDPAPDMATRERTTEPAFWLLPAPIRQALRPPMTYVDSSIPGVALRPARTDALRSWFADEGARLAPGDTLLVYVTDHGERNPKDDTNNTITLWGESLSVEELRALLGLLDPGVRVVLLMSQCFSGSFANAVLPDATALPAGNACGYFASTADRPAYGCYAENLGKDGVGHSYHFLRALRSLGGFFAAGQEVLVTDDSPDVPNSTADVFLERLLTAAAIEAGQALPDFADGLLAEAWKDRGRWEPEIRLLDRIGRAYGFFSPRSLTELEQHAGSLPEISKQLGTYARRWSLALDALRAENWQRFTEIYPEWRGRLDAQISRLDPHPAAPPELLAALRGFVARDPDAHERLSALRQRADDASAASYRMAVRAGVVLRMRAVLVRVAGRVYLDRDVSGEAREAYRRLLACEDLPLLAAAPPAAGAAEAPAAFPTIAEDQRLVATVMPAWMGIRYGPVDEARRRRLRAAAGAVEIATVYPDSPAKAAGLRAGDLILGPPGHPFGEAHQVREWTMRRDIGVPATLEIFRNARRRRVTLHPQPYPLVLPKLPGPPAVGSPAPPLRVDFFRGPRRLAARSPRLLFFWATWCLPCKMALPELLAFSRERDIAVIAITDEYPDALRSFFAQFHEPFPQIVAIDRLRTTFQSYGVSGTPTIVLVDAGGNVRHYQSGYRPDLGLGIDGWHWRPPAAVPGGG